VVSDPSPRAGRHKKVGDSRYIVGAKEYTPVFLSEISRLAADLEGRHVVDGMIGKGMGGREVELELGDDGFVVDVVIGHAGDAKVQNPGKKLRTLLWLEENVFRFEIAMDDAAGVGVGQRREDEVEERQGFIELGAGIEIISEAGTEHMGHDEVGATQALLVDVYPVVEDGDDARVVEPRHGPDLTGEAAQGADATGTVGPDELQGDGLLALGVCGEENFTHATAADHGVAGVSRTNGCKGEGAHVAFSRIAAVD